MRTNALLVSILVAGCAAPMPAGDPSLTLQLSFKSILNDGEKTLIKAQALSSKGLVGTGDITFTTDVGTLGEPASTTLDAYGTASIELWCNHATDPACVTSTATVTATWVGPDGKVKATTRVSVESPPVLWETGVRWPPGGSQTPCLSQGTSGVVPCVNGACRRGFSCVNNQCVLNGGRGGLQFTLRFNQRVDLDLHAEEQVDGGVCETSWENPNRTGAPGRCGGRGSLDLDSNPACRFDDVNIENIIFPQGRPAPGTYTGWVNLFAICAQAPPIAWELQVRAGVLSQYYCGVMTRDREDSPRFSVQVP